jgi:hypothetical protein
MRAAVERGVRIAHTGTLWVDRPGDGTVLCCAVGSSMIDGTTIPIATCHIACGRLSIEVKHACAIADGFDGEACSYVDDVRPWYDLGTRLAAWATEQGWLS